MKLNPYYTGRELKEFGFRALGRSVLISRTCRIYTPEQISIGSHVLIDDFTILNGDITIGDYVHISSNCELYAGEASITLEDFVGLSSRCSLYATNEDFSGLSLTNPTVPRAFRHEVEKPIVLKKHAIVACGSLILPGVTIGEGCVFGAKSVISTSSKPWGIYANVGGMTKRVRDRDKKLLEYEKQIPGKGDQ